MRPIAAALAGVLVLLLGVGLASAAPPKRLSKTQWAPYQKAYTAFTKQTPKSVAKFRSCGSSTTGSRNARAMQHCFGQSGDLELKVTRNLQSALGRFQGKVGGACATALAKYQQALFFWNSTVTGVNRAVHSNVANVATIQGQAAHAREVYPQVQAAARGFTAACKPKS